MYDAGLGHAVEALALTDDAEANEGRARSLALLARTALAVDHDEEASRSAMEALAQARELRLVETEAGARETLARIGQRSGAPEEAERWLIEAVEGAASGGTGAIVAELRVRMTLAFLYYDLARVDDAIEQLRATVRRGAEAGMPWSVHAMDARVLLTLAEYNRGNWDESVRVASVVGESPPPYAEAALSAAATLVMAGRGQVKLLRLLPVLRTWWRKDALIPINIATPAMEMLQLSGDPGAALDIRDEIAASVAVSWGDPQFPAQIRTGRHSGRSGRQGVPGLERGRAQGGGETARAGRGEGHRGGAWAGQRGCRAPVGPWRAWLWLDRLRAEWLRLRLLADVDPPTPKELIAAWRIALESATADNMVFEQARCQARLGAFLLAAGETEEARELIDAARVTARRLGADPLLGELRELGTAPRCSAATAADGLTARERRCLAGGRRPDEPADRPGAVHQRQDRQRPCVQHSWPSSARAAARRPRPCSSERLDRLIGLRCAAWRVRRDGPSSTRRRCAQITVPAAPFDLYVADDRSVRLFLRAVGALASLSVGAAWRPPW